LARAGGSARPEGLADQGRRRLRAAEHLRPGEDRHGEDPPSRRHRRRERRYPLQGHPGPAWPAGQRPPPADAPAAASRPARRTPGRARCPSQAPRHSAPRNHAGHAAALSPRSRPYCGYSQITEPAAPGFSPAARRLAASCRPSAAHAPATSPGPATPHLRSAPLRSNPVPPQIATAASGPLPAHVPIFVTTDGATSGPGPRPVQREPLSRPPEMSSRSNS
jgi:hypothetical protein